MTLASAQSDLGKRVAAPVRSPPAPERRLPIADLALLLVLLAVIVLAAFDIYSNMRAMGMQPGFGFLLQQAGFDLSESVIPYSADSSYLRAILAGLLNTMVVSAVSLVLASLVGLLVALASVSSSAPARCLALGYVELFRNLPKILILLVLFVLAVNGLPPVRQALALGPILISNRALYFPVIAADPRQLWLVAAMVVAIALCIAWRRWARRRRAATGRRLPLLAAWAVIAAAVFGVAISALHIPLRVSRPALAGFNIHGGLSLSLQFGALAMTLGLYHGAQIAEVLRGGIRAIPKGQYAAGLSLGLPPGHVARYVVVPQVLRIVVPSLNNQFVNLIKNTSIAIAVGYSDLMSVGGTIINQTFRPLEVMAVTMAIYLVLCLCLAGVLNAWNERLRRREGRSGRS